MQHFQIKKGVWPRSSRLRPMLLPDQSNVRSAALLGSDFRNLHPRFEVQTGESVNVGHVLFRDRKRPEIAFVSPVAGRVASLDYGPRRTLSACIIKTDEKSANLSGSQVAELPDPDAPRQTLLARGLWPAFRTRPFQHVPAPDAEAIAIVINAVPVGPDAPDPSVVLKGQEEDFHLGVNLIERLTVGPVFICQPRSEPLAHQTTRTRCVSFGGSLAAGLAGTQIDRLCPPAPGQEVWSIGYQDAAAIGFLFRTGQYKGDRCVGIGGPEVSVPRLTRCPAGAFLGDLMEGPGDLLSGPEIGGRQAAYLGRFDEQVTLMPARDQQTNLPWFERLYSGPRALIPTTGVERAMAIDIPPVPLMRALVIGDSETAMRLGCLALVEEDVAALTRVCTSGADYPRLLRRVLDDLKDVAA